MVHHKPRYRFLYIAALLLSLQYAFTLYINSSLLGKYFDPQTINSLYMAGSILTILGLVFSGRFLKYFGNWHLILTGIILEIASLLTLAYSTDLLAIKIAFIAHQALPPLLLFGFDIFFEDVLISNRDSEKVRSYYLTFINSAFVVAPVIVGFLARNDSFGRVYISAAVFLALLWFLVFDIFKGVEPKRYRDIEILPSIKKFIRRGKLTDIFFLNFLLQCFYAIMVIFMAPYLHQVMGLSWESIGLIYTIMLLPFVIFEAPLGKLFNRYHDEKDILIAGFLIMSAATGLMAIVNTSSVVIWAAILFTSRVGASFVEVASEAAFFKRMTEQDASLISIFRLSVPSAYVIAPFVAGFIVPALPVTTLFILLALILLVGMSAAYTFPV